MASADLSRNLLDCSVCLSIYTDPVTLRCGHNFCRVCIDRVLDTQDVYSCPECRAESEDRPVLVRNITLCKIVESFLLPPPPAQKETGIICTYCVDSPVPAVRSCLHCEASLCDKHLRVHSKSPQHVLCGPTASLKTRKCPVHKKILEYYCIKDSVCVCVSCRLDGEHQGHQVDMLDEAFEKKKKKMINVLQELITKREETVGRVQSLQDHRGEISGIAAAIKEKVSALVRDIMRQLEDLEKKVLTEISRQEEQKSWSLFDLIRQLESKKEDLSRKIRHMEEMCNVTDPLNVLRQSDAGDLCDTKDGDDEGRRTRNNELHNGGELDVSVISPTLHTLSDIVRRVKNGIFVQESVDLLLDVNTAGDRLQISSDMKTASYAKNLKHPEAPERFRRPQVLSSTSFASGRHFWEVEVKGSEWNVGMCYTSMEKNGNRSNIGHDDKSWGLISCRFLMAEYSVVHNNKEIKLPGNIISNRFRISLDYEGGQLSFYELCEPIRHLHTFTTTFTEPLHAVLAAWEGSVTIRRLGVGQDLISKDTNGRHYTAP